ncbi:bifunctional riboflavin kinase/FAD synthetase [Aestuariivirga litoralis]|uniref:bifunctional riboflavin kinase/FAD synthetase n=1 Tax=Aestuariivirga litoralis TaxID=2650924 RepID=UPI0018C57BC6|nr:bifunctional riboflavin kinase/FAD synthetase [Aestuariivirga litoralis]MBG1233436.1 bifunctional riboflavin kinase/FAD synthetase [Aestuariivirga litoralis]
MFEVTSENPLPDKLRGGIAAIGNFDGVHRGHQALLAQAKAIAAKEGKPWGVVTFEPHPRAFFRPEQPVFRLTSQALKLRLLKALGADFVSVVTFDSELASLRPEAFIVQELQEKLGASQVIAGFDFHFGAGRKGNADTLRTMGLKVTTVAEVTDEGAGHMAFSSSNIRNALHQGQLRQAARELGYDWMIEGTVVQGDQRGRTIGFPTANIIVEPGVEPARGIYATFVHEAGKAAPIWMGAGYFGDRPTFNTNRTFFEVFLLDQTLDLYGRELLVSFVELIRLDQSFTSVEALIAQMTADCESARRILSRYVPANLPLARLQAEGKI